MPPGPRPPAVCARSSLSFGVNTDLLRSVPGTAGLESRREDFMLDAIGEVGVRIFLGQAREGAAPRCFLRARSLRRWVVRRKRSNSSNATATASTPMIAKFSFRPVERAIDCSRGTSSVRLTPSGVSSNAQARSSAIGHPSTTTPKTSLVAQFGIFRTGNVAAISTRC